VKSIQLSGGACTGATLVQLDAGSDASGGASYDLQPTAPGMCGVEVAFANGLTFSADQSPSGLVVAHGPGCCSGLYPNGAREIEACVDAGADAEVLSDAPSGS
jgi:hypothetical protein